ncbi:hypothetical protein NDU88_001209 [Pleurodeles waltl]|uniref:Uncharacterized protein n=1 Tax=Pleurodeles waltl TaxID=8319 RepID=A0AAV7P6F7_PLEWA|nr:hypothetical protein NDU88_001209 [Pleurodeles waltl]
MFRQFTLKVCLGAWSGHERRWPPRSRALLGCGPWTGGGGAGGALRAPQTSSRPAAGGAPRIGGVGAVRRPWGERALPLQDATTEDGVEARDKKLSRGLKLWLTPGRRRRECVESHPDQQRTGGRWGDEN